MNITNSPKRGEVYFIRIPAGTTVAHEIRYSRPGVIVSADELNGDSHTVNVVFLSTAACEQVSTVDVSRLGARICCLTEYEMESIDSALLHCLGLSPC